MSIMFSKKIKISLTPSPALKQQEINGIITYESFDNDPFFEIWPLDGILKAGWYKVALGLKLQQGEIIIPKIYFDFGNGYSEEYHWKLYFRDAEVLGLVKLPWDCYRLRLDVSETNVVFEASDLTIFKLTKPQAIFQSFKVLEKIGESRASFLKKVVYQKNVKERKKILKSVFDGSYVPLPYHELPAIDEKQTQFNKEVDIAELLTYSTIHAEKLKETKRNHEIISKLNYRADNQVPVDIILPVYNGLHFLEKLIPQIFSNSDLPFTLHIIDDCSPDQEVVDYLQEAVLKYNNLNVTRNTTNLGFTKTVNKLLSICRQDVIVLLNSDIEVPGNWLSTLIAPLLLDDKIGTVTPMSNCATICSFPNLGDNPILDGYDVESLNAPLKDFQTYYEEIPTGVGFCMAINGKMLTKVGTLNEEAFPRGYGEEVDLCFRARKKGYKSVLNSNLFIYHKHGGSFASAEKVKLLNENQKKLEVLHPEFNQVLKKYFNNNTFILQKLAYFIKILQSEGKLVSVFLDHDLGGGTNVYASNYLLKEKENCFLYGQYLNPNRNGDKRILFSLSYKNYNLKFGIDEIQTLFDLFDFYNLKINKIVINNLVSYHNSLLLAKQIIEYKKKNSDVFLQALGHDFFFICPNFLLFRDNKEFCGVPTDLSECITCLKGISKNIDPQLVPNDFTTVEEWRRTWGDLLTVYANELVVFSESTKALFLKVWPLLSTKIQLTPHSLVGFTKNEKRILNIGILGNIHSVAKGARFIQELAIYIQQNNLHHFKLINFGGIQSTFDHPAIIKTGGYSLNELHFKLAQNKVDVIFIPSVWSETFSYTTLEAIETGIPTACFKLGGQFDQVRHYDKGIVVEEINPEAFINAVTNYFN
ncbi:hypothetical protein TH63_04830 [Rufibacter radiotolerans]|uniref:Glycosyltransferase 2-like domain-containing protein n=1 Tax=Rufibacter radiotolerans TaxID=1379910 RepID=A0A0H4VML7_9BACT|nr:glycosyltransferase [Rufibacter radiotolerans]AKQ45112.1 hypothetical protein TH63_04830 [Rufibacter radiotolerans]